MRCEICSKECKGYKGLSLHLKNIHPKIDKMKYYLNYLGKIEYCPICAKKCKFKGLGRGFSKTCCDKNCMVKWTSNIRTGTYATNKTKEKMSLTRKKLFKNNPEQFEKWIKGGHTQEARDKAIPNIKISIKEWVKNNPEKVLEQAKRMYTAGQTPEAIKKRTKSRNKTLYDLYTSDPSEKNYYL